MKEKELQLVTFEQAKKLSNIGFDGKTNYYFRPYNSIPFYSTSRYNFNECNDDINVGSYQCSAPTVAHALKWIRDQKNLHGFCDRNATEWYFKICKADNGTTVYGFNYYDEEFESYEAAESELLDKLLTILEKEKKQ
jgi:hypothetical protein